MVGWRSWHYLPTDANRLPGGIIRVSNAVILRMRCLTGCRTRRITVASLLLVDLVQAAVGFELQVRQLRHQILVTSPLLLT